MTGSTMSDLPAANSIVEYKARSYRMQPVSLLVVGPGWCKGCAFANNSEDCVSSPPCESDMGADLIFVEVLPEPPVLAS